MYGHKSPEKKLVKNNRHHYTHIQMPKSFLFSSFYGSPEYKAISQLGRNSLEFRAMFRLVAILNLNNFVIFT